MWTGNDGGENRNGKKMEKERSSILVTILSNRKAQCRDIAEILFQTRIYMIVYYENTQIS